MSSILLVEDEPVLRRTISDAMEQCGHQTQVAAEGERAMRLLQGIRFDAVVADLRLPGPSGLDLLRASRRLPQPPLFVLMTAFGTIELAVDAMREGAHDFLTKPFRIERLLLLLADGLGSHVPEQGGMAEEPALPLSVVMAERERQVIHRALRACGGCKSETARRLGISRKALWEKLKKLEKA